MNIFKTDINGKLPFVLDDLRFMDNIYRKSFEALMNGLNPNCIIYGCNYTTTQGTVVIDAGAVVINGEICLVKAHTVNAMEVKKIRFELKESVNSAGNKLFGDGTIHETYLIREAEGVVFTTPLPNDVLLGTHSLLEQIAKWTESEEGFATSVVVSDSNKLSAINIESAFNKSFATKSQILQGDSVNTVVSPKRLQEHGNWMFPTCTGNWTTGSPPLKYRKTTDNHLEIVGIVFGDEGGSSLIFTLPTEYRPQNNIKQVGMADNKFVILTINTNGFVTSSAYGTVCFNVSIPLDN